MLDINSFLEKYISPDEKIILACSSGPDSIFLLHKILESTYRNNLIVCYFNHHLRQEAKEEAIFISKLAHQYDFQLEIGEAHIEDMRLLSKSVSLEELARKERYEFLEKIREKYKASHILTAHHLDDRIETFLFNLLRGTKLTGLINMTEKSGMILRPLLGIEKKDILGFLEKNGITYKLDSSNDDITLTRNFLRKEVLPLFEKVNKNYKGNIAHTLNYFEELKDNIDTQVQSFLIHKDFFYIDEFLSKSEFLQREIIHQIFWKTNNHSSIGLSEATIAEIIRFVKNKGNYTKKEIKNMSLIKENNIVKISSISHL